MDNPWATTWDHRDQDVPVRSWSADTWPATRGTLWPQNDASWDPSTAVLSQDTTAQDHHNISRSPALVETEPHTATATSVSDHQGTRFTSPPRDTAPETTDAIHCNVALVTSVSVEEDLETAVNPPDGDWGMAWATTPSSDADSKETQSPDQWEAARREKETLNCAMPPELLDSLLCHCQQVLQEIWPASEAIREDNWRLGFDNHADIAALLAQFVPADSTLPPTVPFSATATANAMNEALKLTRHLSMSTSSPLSRLSASKGSLEWEKSIKAKQDVVLDATHVGWRVLEKEDRFSTFEESKPRKTTSGLLSFWNRKTSAIQAASVETSERSRSPPRSSIESVKSAQYPSSSRATSPSKASTSSTLPPPLTDPYPTVVATTPAPSAVSRFLNRFSRTKGSQHNPLALSSDDLEFLSDIVPSASDPPDEGVNDGSLGALPGVSDSLPLPPRLPPPIPPPPKQPVSNHPSATLRPGTLNSVDVIKNGPTAFQNQTSNRSPNVPVLAPPLSPKPAVSFSRSQSPPLSPRVVLTTSVPSGQLNIPSMQQRLPLSSQPSSRSPPPQETPPLLSIPPLLPPPPVSPPQTLRPSIFPSVTIPSQLSKKDTFSFHNSYDCDDEFSAFTSFPPPAPAPLPSSESYPPQESSPPSPPPRRAYERTHYPSSPSTSSILSPTSKTSLDHLCSARSSVSASLDSFDDFVSPPPVVRGENRKRTPSPPPLPVKLQLQHRQLPRVDTFSSRVYHAHTPSQSFASPTVHTSLMNSAFSVPSVSDAEHQRTQTLVNHAAARGGILWPNSPDSDEPRARAILPPPSSSISPKSLVGREGLDLLSDGDTFDDGLEVLPAPLGAGTGTGSTVPPPTTSVLHVSFEVEGGLGKGVGLRNQLQPSPSPPPSTSVPILSLSSLGPPLPLTAINLGSLQPTKPKQTGGLSAQDLSFFEGL